MKNDKDFREQSSDISAPDIPDIRIIDLEAEELSESSYGSQENDEDNEDFAEDYEDDSEYFQDEEREGKKHRFRINMHVILLLTAVVFVALILYRFLNWGVKVDLDEIFQDGPGTYSDTLDEILPLINDSGETSADDGVTTIVAFGNAPFADDRNSEDSLASMIEDLTGATVYNCAVSGSYLAALSPQIDSQNYPMDAFNFYWLCTLATGGPIDYFYEEVWEVMGDDLPPEAEEVYNTLKTLDFNTVDVITIMYDASDYLAGHEMYSDQNSTDIMQFTGNMEAGIELLQSAYPHIRIIVMSPTYAFAVNEQGEYVSSDMYTYGEQDVLSTYVIRQYASAATRSVSFVDNLYGTITEDNASEYLTDNLHLNVAGRRLVAERFEYALNYYNREDG